MTVILDKTTEPLLAIGEITRAHGLRGEVRVTPLTDHPERFGDLTACVLWDATRDGREPRRILTARRRGETILMTLAGCDSVEAARALVGRLIAIPREAALPPPPGSFYPWQLHGARVVTEDGQGVGRLTGIEHSVAHDLWIVERDGREHLIPAVADIVLDVDVAAARVVIRPPEGLLEL